MIAANFSISLYIEPFFDAEFKVDPAKLYDEFSHFSEYQLIGIANDLSPHYYQMLSK